MPTKRPLSRRHLSLLIKGGCTLREDHIDANSGESKSEAGADTFTMQNVHGPDGSYVGSIGKNSAGQLRSLLKRGIVSPERARAEDNVASIGRGADGKWYGWSHRAIYGFGIGHTVKPGDCGYTPSTREEVVAELRTWHADEWKSNIVIEPREEGVFVAYDITDERGKVLHQEHVEPWPEMGRGEWTAETDADAKQMAIDFANGVG